MDLFKLKEEVEKYELEIFTLNDLVKITQLSKESINQFLNYNIKKGSIKRIKKGYYSFHTIDSKFLYQKIFDQTYISLNSGLEYYQSTTQRYATLELISKKRKNNQKIGDTSINFINSNYFFGYQKEKINKTDIFIASKEKLLLDCLMHLDKIYLSEIYQFIQKTTFDTNLIKNYLNIINSKVLNKRLGYLLEINNINIEVEIDSKLDRLNPLLKKSNNFNRKWNLYINEEL